MVLHFLEENKPEMAQTYLYKYKVVSDSIHLNNLKDKTNLVNKLIYLQTLEVEKKHLEKTKTLQEESIRRRNLLLVLTLFFAILSIWFAIKIMRVNKKVKRTNQTLTEQNEIIKKQNTHLEVLISTKDKLFSIIAHDLRSPFNSILGFSNLLLEDKDEFSPKQITRQIGLINSNAKSTLDLLDNLLDWAKNQTGQINFNPENTRIDQIISDVIKLLESSAQLKNITIIYKPEPEIKILADKNMLKTIIRNLIQNSIKFTPTKGVIEILAREKEEDVEISIIDNGIGMNSQIKESLFLIDKCKGQLGTAKEKGSGLGLVLCKEFVEKHKGKIWVESKENQGSTFSFTIPSLKPNS